MNHKRTFPKTYVNSIFISVFICCVILLWCLQSSKQFEHWFLIPVTLSGIVIGIDAIKWFRNHLNIFDPVGIIGVLGFHFFFLAPILHVSWDRWLEAWFDYPPDWRPWLGGMAILNLLGLLAYRFCRNLVVKKPKNPSTQIVWQINLKRFYFIVSFAMIFSAVLQIGVYQQFGGVMGYIASATQEGESNLEGMGIVFLFSETFPILAMMVFSIYAQKNKRFQSWPILILVLLVFLVLQMFFGGLRGSRSNTIWALFWAAGMIHFMIRPITKKEVAIGIVFLLFFMYLYGFFKAGGLDGVNTALESREDAAQLEEKSGRTWQGLLLGDIGRSDVHAYMLYRLMLPHSDYEYVWGETYIAGATILIPKFIMPDKPFKHKVMQGTELFFGKGSYKMGVWETSKVYGIAGEAMLNFGFFAVPLAFIPLGILVGWVQRCLLSWKSSDSRLILLPMLVNFCFMVLTSDFDNDIFFLIKNSGLPVLVVWLSSQKELIDIVGDREQVTLRQAQCIAGDSARSLFLSKF
ncbi:hypothetical protein FJR04_06405 [Anabaena sp. UHCC 0204]|nr:hypothetical protein [Anabaena sp. UHCC 0204]